MKYTVKRSCGHEERIALFGSYTSRESQLKYEASKLCKACYIEEKRREEKALTQELGLPELTGTEKQVAWANSIRLEWINRVFTKLDNWKERGTSETDIERCRRAVLAAASTKTQAAWWIEHDNMLDLKLQPEYKKALAADA